MCLKDMPAVGGDLATHLNVRSQERLMQLQSLAVQQLIGTRLDQGGWQASQIGVNWRYRRRAGGRVAKIVRRARSGPGHTQHGFARWLIHGRILHCHVNPGREQDQGCWHG